MEGLWKKMGPVEETTVTIATGIQLFTHFYCICQLTLFITVWRDVIEQS